MHLLRYPNGNCEVIDRALDSYDLRECEITEVTPELVKRLWEQSVLAGATAKLLLAKVRMGIAQGIPPTDIDRLEALLTPNAGLRRTGPTDDQNRDSLSPVSP